MLRNTADEQLNQMSTFYQIVANTLFATTTTILAWFAVTFWAYLQTNSVLVTTALALMFLLGNLATGFIFGSFVDHYRKRIVLIASDVATAGFFILAFIVYITGGPEDFTQTTSPRLWVLLLLVFAGITAPNLRNIALSTLVTMLVPEDRRDRANGLVGIVSGLGFLLGSLFSGFLIAISGIFWVLLIPIIVRGFTIAHLLLLKLPERPRTGEAGSEEAQPGAGQRFDLRGTFRLVNAIPGLFALLLFTCLNNFLSGAFMPLLDPYGLSMMSAEAWGVLSGILGLGFVISGFYISRRGLGERPLRTLFIANIVIWLICTFFTIQPSILLLAIGFFIFPLAAPFIEASEHTIIQKLVPPERQGRVFGFAQSVELSASPISTLLVGPLAHFVFIPFMTTGAGAELIGSWFGTGDARGMALLFTLTGAVGLVVTLFAMNSRAAQQLSDYYAQAQEKETAEAQPEAPNERDRAAQPA